MNKTASAVLFKTMEMQNKILKIIEILKTESDEQSPIRTNRLIGRLADCGISVERKTLYKDIDRLIAAGYDVVKVRDGRSSAYYMNASEFDTSELKILLDAVEASRFISAKKTDELVKKLAVQAGNLKGDVLARMSVCFDTVKHTNDKVFIIVDRINDALITKKKVSFRYFDFDVKGEKVLRRGGEPYIVNPVALVFSEDNYYLVCYNDKYQDLSNYRIDKMLDVEVTDDDITPSECVKDFKFYSHPKQSFSMFRGEIEKVTLECENSLANVIIDRFGEKIKMTPKDSEKFTVTVPVQVSPTFYAWCFTFGRKMKIISPQSVADGYKAKLSETLDSLD